MSAATIALTARPSLAVRWARFPIRELGRVLLYALLAVAILLFAFLAVAPRVVGYRTVTMLTGSMRPLIPPGAVAVDFSEPVSALRPGQVISFHAPEPGRPVVTHRVVAVRRIGGRVVIQTKGDANNARDPWLAVVHGDKVWRVRGAVPYLGFGIHALRSGTTRLLVTWLVPLGALCWFLLGVWRPSEATDSLMPEGGEPSCPAVDMPTSPASPALPSRPRSSSRRRSTSRSRSRKRRQRQMRNCRRQQRRSRRSSR